MIKVVIKLSAGPGFSSLGIFGSGILHESSSRKNVQGLVTNFKQISFSNKYFVFMLARADQAAIFIARS